MKKIITALLSVVSVVSVFAQPVIKVTNKENLRQEIASMFQREQEAHTQGTVAALTKLWNVSEVPSETPFGQISPSSLSSYAGSQTGGVLNNTQPRTAGGPSKSSTKVRYEKADKPWQLAMFIAVDRVPLSETIGSLRWLIRQGSLRRATLINIQEYAPADSKGTIYFVYGKNGKPVVETVKFPVTISAAEVLVPLLQGMESSNLYTGILINAHGDGQQMLYGEKGWIKTDELLTGLQNSRLTADVLELQSCHMGSFDTVYQVARRQNVKYLVASSDFHYTAGYGLLKNTQYTPKSVAVNLVRQYKKVFDFYPGYVVNNLLAIDLQPLYKPLATWLASYQELQLCSKDELIDKPFDPKFGEVRSLKKIIRKQIKMLEEDTREDLANGLGVNWNELKEEFINRSHTLLNALDKSLLTQWCYSPQTDRLYTGRIPPNIDCSDNISVTKEQLQTLLVSDLTISPEKRCRMYWWY